MRLTLSDLASTNKCPRLNKKIRSAEKNTAIFIIFLSGLVRSAVNIMHKKLTIKNTAGVKKCCLSLNIKRIIKLGARAVNALVKITI